MYFSSYKNCKLKVKLWSIGAHKRKKSAFFVTFILPKGNFLNIWVLFQCLVYWIHFQNTYILLHIKKHYFIHFCCLFLKSSKAFSVSIIAPVFSSGISYMTHVWWISFAYLSLLSSVCKVYPLFSLKF